MEKSMKILSSACQMTGYRTWFLYSTSMQVWIIMCYVPRRRAVCQEEVEKELFAFAITSKPHEMPIQDLKEVLCYTCVSWRSTSAISSGMFQLTCPGICCCSSCSLTTLQPLAEHSSAAASWWMVLSGWKWQQFNVKCLWELVCT